MKRIEKIQVKSYDDLQKEMRRVKQRIKDSEEDLGKRLRQVPGEAVKLTVGAILPLVMGGGLGGGVWKLVKGLFELIKKRKADDGSGGGWKEDLAGGAKKLGLFAALKLLFNLWKGK